jgi:hypothetical protein
MGEVMALENHSGKKLQTAIASKSGFLFPAG